MKKWLTLFYIAAFLASAELIYQFVQEVSINWFYFVILISQIGAIYAAKKEQKEQVAE
ncbi:hypothetical protein [Terribacillus sp. DMT04]|uniref:hypothetical protein n=1 Tax=Terribacillus sp. DMT04 TaxID=2850441 RepID=UPI001C2C7508|nr:hypothetical protein [Terribacillus sp. DMT04]QXE01654.1 hypothetical protein KS242_17110 [Terribacillus sp. DMT04]